MILWELCLKSWWSLCSHFYCIPATVISRSTSVVIALVILFLFWDCVLIFGTVFVTSALYNTTVACRAGESCRLDCYWFPEYPQSLLWHHPEPGQATCLMASCGYHLTLPFEWRRLKYMSPAAQGLHAKAWPRIQGAAHFLHDSPRPSAWHGVTARCHAGSAPLSTADRPDPGSDRLALWSRRSSDPTALLCVVYLQVLAPAQRKKQGCLALPFPDRNQKLTMLKI